MALPRTVFLDRDGVINRAPERYVLAWEQFEFLPGALAALKRLHENGVQVVVVTNQSAVGRGWLAQATLDDIHARMQAAVATVGGAIVGVYACPHLPSVGCVCRKPQPGLLRQAAAELGLDLRAAHLIGDHASDIQAACAAGVSATLVLTGRGFESWRDGQLPPCDVAADLSQAVERLLAPDAPLRSIGLQGDGAP